MGFAHIMEKRTGGNAARSLKSVIIEEKKNYNTFKRINWCFKEENGRSLKHRLILVFVK